MNDENNLKNNDLKILENVSLDKRAIIETKNSLSAEEMNRLDYTNSTYREIEECISNTCYAKSKFVSKMLFLDFFFKNNFNTFQNIDLASIKKDMEIIFEISKLINQITKKVFNYDKTNNDYNNLIILSNQYNLIETTLDGKPKIIHVDNILIQSIFQDYYILYEWQKSLKTLSPEIINGFVDFFETLKGLLYNTLCLIDEPEPEIKFRIGRVYISRSNTFNFKITEDILNCIKNDYETINELSILLLNSPAKKEPIEHILKIIEELDFNKELDEIFNNLSTVFSNDVKLTLTKKKLFLHDVFQLFKHPMAFTKEEESEFENRSKTLYAVEKEKVRKIDRYVKYPKKNGQNKMRAKKIVSK